MKQALIQHFQENGQFWKTFFWGIKYQVSYFVVQFVLNQIKIFFCCCKMLNLRGKSHFLQNYKSCKNVTFHSKAVSTFEPSFWVLLYDQSIIVSMTKTLQLLFRWVLPRTLSVPRLPTYSAVLWLPSWTNQSCGWQLLVYQIHRSLLFMSQDEKPRSRQEVLTLSTCACEACCRVSRTMSRYFLNSPPIARAMSPNAERIWGFTDRWTFSFWG